MQRTISPSRAYRRLPVKPEAGRTLDALEELGRRLGRHLGQMALERKASGFQDCLDCIRRCSTAQLHRIVDLIRSEQIDPCHPVRLDPVDAPPRPAARPLRIGVYPIAGDPLHWGHLLCGLTAMAQMSLDKVIFMPAGTDPRKPRMTDPAVRHRLVRSAIRAFEPLFAYTPIALGTDLEGEKNIIRLLELNAEQEIDAVYLAGSDHCHRLNGRGEPDTLLKLEEETAVLRARKEDRRHRLSLLFLAREEVPRLKEGSSVLDVHMLAAMPISCSSTAIRQALSDGGKCDVLATLPFPLYREIRRQRLYAGRQRTGR